MNIHAKFVGALEPLILSSLAAATVAMLFVLLIPSFDNSSAEMIGERATVTIEQIA